MTDPAVTGAPAPVSYSLPRTNAKVLALLEPHLAHGAAACSTSARAKATSRVACTT